MTHTTTVPVMVRWSDGTESTYDVEYPDVPFYASMFYGSYSAAVVRYTDPRNHNLVTVSKRSAFDENGIPFVKRF